jgi:hypothetical protein
MDKLRITALLQGGIICLVFTFITSALIGRGVSQDLALRGFLMGIGITILSLIVAWEMGRRGIGDSEKSAYIGFILVIIAGIATGLMNNVETSMDIEMKIYSIFKWLALPFIILALIELPRDIKKWYSVKMIYHRIPWRIIRAMKNIHSDTAKNWSLRIFFIILFIIVFLEIKYLTQGSYYPRILFLILLLITIQRNLRYLVPPSAIFLTASHPDRIKLLTYLTRALKHT